MTNEENITTNLPAWMRNAVKESDEEEIAEHSNSSSSSDTEMMFVENEKNNNYTNNKNRMLTILKMNQPYMGHEHDEDADDKVEKLIKRKLLRFSRRRRLLCKNGMYLAIDKNGVHGTKDPNNPYAEIQVLSIGSDMVALWGTRAGLYLAVNQESGKISTTAEEGRHCVFIETVTPDFHNIFESYKSVYENHAQFMALNSQNKLAMIDHKSLPDRNGQFLWEIIPT